MVDFFDKWYSSVGNKNKFLEIVRYYSLKRFCIRLLANVFIPAYFRLSPKTKLDANQQTGVIVSLTTFPARIHKIWIVIESILRQQYKPDKVILWLSSEQFKSVAVLPARLQKLQERGLQIRIVDGDIKSHKKYYYFLKEYKTETLITVDDDIIYPKSLISVLIKYHQEFPDAICCHRAKLIKKKNSDIAPYNEWPELRKQKAADLHIFQTSGGGTLFPPDSLHSEVLNEKVFTEYCFFADDIWLNCMSQMNNTLIVKTDYYSDCLPILFWKTVHLSTINVDNNGNDRQLAAVRNYYIQNKGIDPFLDFLASKKINNL